MTRERWEWPKRSIDRSRWGNDDSPLSTPPPEEVARGMKRVDELGVSRWIAISDKFHPESLVMAEPELRLVEKVRERDAVSSQMYCLHTGYHCVATGQQRENVPIPSEEKHWSTTPDASRLISWINLLQLTVFLHKLIRKVSKYLSVMVHDCIWGLRFLYISHM